MQRSAEALPVRGIRSRPSPREQPTTGQSLCATHELQGSEKYGQTVCLGMSLTCWLEVQICLCRHLKLYHSIKVELALCVSHLKRPGSYDKSSSNNKCDDKPSVDSSLFDAVLEAPDDHVPILTREEYVASNLDSIIMLYDRILISLSRVKHVASNLPVNCSHTAQFRLQCDCEPLKDILSSTFTSSCERL